MKASKIGLRSINFLKDTQVLILFFKILVHIPLNERKDVFKCLKDKYNLADKKFLILFNYFQRYWIESYYISYEDYGSQLFSRTNNVSERYNFRLQEAVHVIHPRLSILVKSLIEEEQIFKKIGLDLYSQTNNFESKNENSVNLRRKLCFSEIDRN